MGWRTDLKSDTAIQSIQSSLIRNVSESIWERTDD